ncbi:MAG: T9SS type A sorting domain-containing protein [Saprospiraceae bacterium]|nr:T9SS type A sorting domain-containing protein [Saprospiraceae bacterium]
MLRRVYLTFPKQVIFWKHFPTPPQISSPSNYPKQPNRQPSKSSTHKGRLALLASGQQLDVQALAPGMYSLRVVVGERVFAGKFVKQ